MLTMTAMYVNGGGNQRYARWNRQDSLEDYTRSDGYEQDGEGKQRKLTPFEKLTHDMSHDEKTVKELTLGKRIGFYRLRGEIGSGNFSQVKLGIHVLTKGTFFELIAASMEKDGVYVSKADHACYNLIVQSL